MMEDKLSIEELFELQDLNKRTKLNATTDEQLAEVERIEKNILERMKEIEVGKWQI